MSNFKTTTTMSDTITLNKLSVGFGSNCERTDTDAFTITGDITIQVTDGMFKRNISVYKLKVVYNHNGLLEHAIQSEHTDLEVFYDAEHRFVEQEIDYPTTYAEHKLATDGNSIELYADFEIYGEDVY